MAKNSLVGGSLWDNYSDIVSDRMNNPKHMGSLTEEDAKQMGGKLIVADFGAESCGDAVRLFWIVNEDTDVIISSKFKSFGCGTAIASSDTMAELCLGKTVDEALKITNIDVEFAMRDNPDIPAVPPQKMHCSVMAYDVIKQAAANYKGVEFATLEDQEIVCECARVSMSTIKDAIRINNLTTVEEITQYTKAGAFCKSCIKPGGHEKKEHYLVDILRDTLAEMAKEKGGEESYASMSNYKKTLALEKVFDGEIRPLLVRDGGNVEIDDIYFDPDYTLVSIKYQGACAGCASSGTGTLQFIQSALRELDEDITVRMV
ncbi:iron-sulfur cluster assembly scaffold protein NifU [Thiospirochaeta perfilievii]|uniref:Nitrogen fixation protein NifU n=1 Tax=Thiospirochaeta perfilievii TaxID=252967 RepID=A0A5C1QBT9_9SPIO|nr:iron-sulfur cluster assembly scaffold protein [Thiospirochaeta perfilievii]QEN04540.1 iron-sulfur cluster assembly scaffold protein NifU [Thiospirochaeta perfilievii]